MRAFLMAVAAFAVASCATTTDPGSGGDGDIRSIVLEEEPCFGFCPVYEITLMPGDRYHLNAMRHTASEGRSEGQLDAGGFEAAVAAVRAADFANLPGDLTYNNAEACPGPQVSDMPYTRVTVEYADRTHSVHHYQGCSAPAMRQLREDLRAIIDYNTRIRPQN